MKSSVWQKFIQKPGTIAALLVLAAFIVCAISVEIYSICCEANHITPAYMISDPANTYAPPSVHHWLGTDYQGRDVGLRALAGCATALKVGLISGLISVVIGVGAGALAGFYGGKTDDLTVWLYSTFAAMPTLLFILAFALLISQEFLSPQLMKVLNIIASILRTEPAMLGVYCAIGLSGWIGLCRVVRSETMKLRERQFVLAAKVAGVSTPTIIMRHILPNIMHLVIIYFTTLFAGAVMLEVIASYLGLGAQSLPSWGVMISDGQQRLWAGVWWEITAASGMLFLLVLSLNMLGDALRDAFDPKFG